MSGQKISRKFSILSIMLFAQCLLITYLWLTPQGDETFTPAPLLATAGERIERIVITADQPLTLRQKNASWYINNGDLPADPEKVTLLLDKIEALHTTWPVANSKAAATRFEVAENNFQRKVQIFSDDTELGALYVGTSPSFNRAHIRRHGDDDIYALAINIHDMPATQDAWLQRNLLQPQSEIQRISSGDVHLDKKDGHWRLRNGTSDTAGAARADQPPLETEALVSALKDLMVLGVADSSTAFDNATAEQEAGAMPAEFTIDVATSDGEMQYQFMQREGQYYVQRADMDTTFRIAKDPYETLAKFVNYVEDSASS